VDAGAVELQIVLSGLKDAQRQLEAFQKSASKSVAPKKDPFAAYNKASNAVNAARRLKKEMSTLGGVARVAGRQAKKAFTGLNAAMLSAAKGADSLLSRFGALASITGGISIAAFAGNVLRVGLASQKSGRQLSFLAASYGEVEQASQSVSRISAVLATSTLEAEQAFGKFYGSLRPAGLELDEIETIYVGIAKAGRLAGAGTQELQSGLLQVKQAFTAGRLSGDELRSVLENLPALGVEVAKAYDKLNGTTGTTVGALRELGAAGKLTNDVLFEATKTLALKDVPAPTTVEAITTAFNDMSQNIAKAIGPAVVEMMSTFSAAVQIAAEWVQKNADGITSIVKGVITFIKAAAPFAMAVGTIVAAIKLWRLALIGAAKAQALMQALSGPKGWKVLAVGAAVYLGSAAAINKANEGIDEGMKKVGKRTEELKAQFKDLATNVNSGQNKGIGDNLKIGKLTEQNKELKQAEKLAIEQSKALYGPETQKVISARIKLAQAEREASIAQQAAALKGDDDKLRRKAEALANAQVIAAEVAAQTIKKAYDEAKKSAIEAADALGEARTARAKQLFGKDGINRYLGGDALRSRRVQGMQMQQQEAARLAAELQKKFREEGNEQAARQIGSIRFRGNSQQVFEQRQQFIDSAREELYGSKALITANENLTTALADLNTTIEKGFGGGTKEQKQDYKELKTSIDNLAAKDWEVKVDARMESDGTIKITNAMQ
jgi:tape measure domain-containing protein